MVEQEGADQDTVVVEDELFDSYTPEDENDHRYAIKKSRTFYGASPLKRIATLFAGPFFNLLAAIAIFISIFVYNGGMYEIKDCIIAEVVENYPAALAGVQANDKVIGISFDDGGYAQIDSYVDFDVAIQLHKGGYTLHLDRSGETVDVHITPKFIEEENRYMIGVSLIGNVSWKELNFMECVVEGTKYTFENISVTIQSVIQLVTGKLDMNNVSGTLGMYSYTEEALSYGFVTYLSLVASISISLSIMNLIPVPVFDGGRIVMTVIEMIIGKRLDKKFENTLLTIGMILILLLFVVVTINDILKMIG